MIKELAVGGFSVILDADIEDVAGSKSQSRRRGQPSCCASNSCCSSSSASSSTSSQYTTIGSNPASNPYETRTSLDEYLLMHFGSTDQLLPFDALRSEQLLKSICFPRECAEICGRMAQKYLAAIPADSLRAFDVGCAVGRSSFELTRFFRGGVVGLDYSQSFIDAAEELKNGGQMEYRIKIEGDIYENAVAKVDEKLDRSLVRFVRGDACDLSLSALGGQRFHMILGANLLCRLPNPRKFLRSLPKLLEVGRGIIVLPSPYTWLEMYTPKSEWVGGKLDAATGKPKRSAEELKEIMEGDGYFKLVESHDVPFFIRETARKNQWSVSHVTVWKRTDKPDEQ